MPLSLRMPELRFCAREAAETVEFAGVCLLQLVMHRRPRGNRRFVRAAVAFVLAMAALQMPRRSWAAPPDDGVPRGLRPPWALDNMMSDNTVWSLTRFRKADLPRLFTALRIPDTFVVNGETIPGMEALVCMLVRLHSPGTLENVRTMMRDRHCTRTYGHMFYFVIDHIFDRFKRCIDDIRRWEEWVRRAPRSTQLNLRNSARVILVRRRISQL